MSHDVAELMQVVESTARAEERRRRRKLRVTVAVSVLAGTWLVFSAIAASRLESQNAAAARELQHVRAKTASVTREFVVKQAESATVSRTLAETEQELKETRDGLAEQQAVISRFLLETMDSSRVQRLGPSVDWKLVQDSIASLKPGRRQAAVLIALLSTWREVRYQSGGTTLEATDGQRFADLVISKAGLPPTRFAEGRASEALMRRFNEKTANPEPGDLMFFRSKGQCRIDGGGNACCMYLAPSKGGGPGICVGLPIMFSTRAAQVLDTGTSRDGIVSQCEFIGYFRVPYEEK